MNDEKTMESDERDGSGCMLVNFGVRRRKLVRTNNACCTDELPPIFRAGNTVSGGGAAWEVLEVNGEWIKAVIGRGRPGEEEVWTHPASTARTWRIKSPSN